MSKEQGQTATAHTLDLRDYGTDQSRVPTEYTKKENAPSRMWKMMIPDGVANTASLPQMPRIVLVTGCSTGGIGYSLFVVVSPLNKANEQLIIFHLKGVKNLLVKDAKSMQLHGRPKPLQILVIGRLKKFLLMLQAMKVFRML